MSDYIVEMKNITKTFPGVRALSNVNLSVKKGEVHALVGENGAGKSTLIKILTGAYQKDSGSILFDGRDVDIKNPHFSKSMGIHAVYQDIMLAQHLSVGENFFLGELPMNSPFTVDWKKVYSVAGEVLQSLDLKIDPYTLVKNLPVAQQEMVAIAKALYEKSKLMIFDEPTRGIDIGAKADIYQRMRDLTQRGVGVIMASSELPELIGTPKQVAWGETCRFKLLERVQQAIDNYKRRSLEGKLYNQLIIGMQKLCTETKAHWWIENRDMSRSDIIILLNRLYGQVKYEPAKQIEAEQKKAVDIETTVRPERPVTETVAVTGELKSKTTAGILGILLGGLGVHRFYLGYTGIGIAQILVTIFTLGIGSLWGFIEGILILTGSINKDAKGQPLQG